MIQKNASFLHGAVPAKADVALLYNPENQVFGWAATGSEMNVTDSLRGVHRALYEANFVVDFVHPREITSHLLGGYRVIVVPFPYLLDRRTCELLAAWVDEGGVLVGESYFAGWHREEGHHQTIVPGYGLDRLFRARQGTAAPPPPGGDVEIIAGDGLPHVEAGTRIAGAIVSEALVPEGADVLARFTGGEPAVTCGSCGRGYGILIGSYVGLPLYRGHHPSNADFIVSLVDLKHRIPRPTVSGGGKVRVDLLTHPGAGRMLILRNLEEKPVRARVFLPGAAPGRLVEQFDGRELTLSAGVSGAEASVVLAPSEVQVYRD